MTFVEGYCNRCHRDIGPVAWDADLVLCRRCVKAEEIYTPPRPVRIPDFDGELIRRMEAARASRQ